MSDDDFLLQASVRAVRSAGDTDHSELASSTRTRLRRSLVRRARGRRRLVQLSLVVSVLLVSTLSWAISTGRISLRRSEPEPVLASERDVDPATSMRLPEPQRAARAAPEPWPAVVPPPAPVEKPADKPTDKPKPPVVKPVVKPTPVEVLYRKAHELHFHGRDHAAALAAWNTYLAVESTGRFAVEARYNRALVLARLGRYAEAREALLPFARGEVATGYREAEAKQIVERLEALAPVESGK